MRITMPGRRRVLAGLAAGALSGTALLCTPALGARMPHLVLLGDSIFDNARYTGGAPDVIAQTRTHLPPSWRASLLAVDGATTRGVASQLTRLPPDASHLVLSVGGNDALGQTGLLDLRVTSSAQAFDALASAVHAFEKDYRAAVTACLRARLPLVVCTIYNGSFPDAQFQRRAQTALAAFNDVILRTCSAHALGAIELRHICTEPEDYANPIEPSSVGGDKIARAIVRAVVEPQRHPRAWILV